ncbi:unnamed protein product [Caenorhabditis brenneri]
MLLSRPSKFPLLKLPWLCIKCVVQNSDLFDIIYFATISNRTRRIVRSSNYPLKEIDIPNGSKHICMVDKKSWHFTSRMYGCDVPLVLQRNSSPIPTCRNFNNWRGNNLYSYTAGDTLDAMKMVIEFMINVFGCAIKTVFVDGNTLSELLGLGIRSVKELFIYEAERGNIKDLKYLLENVKVTDRCVFNAPIPENFHCEPQIFKCRRLSFMHRNSADWVTLELLCQFDVPQLNFRCHRFSEEDIVSYVTYWFNSENRKLDYLFVSFGIPLTMENFKIDHLNPMPFCEKRRNRCPFVGGWEDTDISSGIDIIREDGLLATFFVKPTAILFYIWHKRFLDAVRY